MDHHVVPGMLRVSRAAAGSRGSNYREFSVRWAPGNSPVAGNSGNCRQLPEHDSITRHPHWHYGKTTDAAEMPPGMVRTIYSLIPNHKLQLKIAKVSLDLGLALAFTSRTGFVSLTGLLGGAAAKIVNSTENIL